MNYRLACAGIAARAAALALVLACSLPCFAQQVQTMDQLNTSVWSRLYHASRVNDPTWLAADDDGDGISNGDEIAAGTNPFDPGSTIQVTNTTLSSNTVHLTFQTLKGKYYSLQSSTDLTNPASWAAVVPTAGAEGNGAAMTLDAPYAANTFYRVLVQDLDSDGDGISDWAELQLGLDPKTAQSNNSVDQYGRPLMDNEYASNNIGNENVVSVTALGSDGVATEPDPGQSASDSGTFTITRGGLPAVLGAITVNLVIGGNAVPGADYTPLNATVLMPAGARTVLLPVTPLANPTRTTPVVVSVAIAAGSGYSISPAAPSAGVTILPTGTPSGTGLTGSYFNNASTSYTATTNFKPSSVTVNTANAAMLSPAGSLVNGSVIYLTGSPLPAPLSANTPYYVRDVSNGSFNVAAGNGGAAIALTSTGSSVGYFFQRLDPTVDFKWNGTQGALPSGITGSSFCVRWTGQIQPQYSETYHFVVNARQGCVLKVAGQPIINYWASISSVQDLPPANSTPDGTITLQAGVRYDIQLDYFSNSGASVSETHLYWYSDSQAKQIVPTGRLYPSNTGAAAAPPTITSASQAFAFRNQPLAPAFQITTSSSASTAIAITGGTLPPGMNYATTTNANGANIGLIGGTPTKAGDFPLVITATNSAGSSSSVLDLQVLDSGNLITKEVWTGLPASATPSVRDIPVGTTPNITGTLTSFEDTAANYGDNYGERIRGYISVPTTGMYYFYVAGNDVAELWISTDSEQVNKVKRCSTTGSTSRQWSASAAQKSDWLLMTAGVKYYVELLHRGVSASSNNIAVGYQNDAKGYSSSITDGTGVMPGYLLWQYYTPPVAFSSDTSTATNLFFTKMTSQGNSITTGSGLATLRLSSDEKQATLKFSYSGLTTPVTGKHIHNDQYLSHPSQIIFDIDSATPNPDGSYTWVIAPIGDFTNTADIVQLIREGKAYINIHTVDYPSGEIRGNFTIANGAQQFVPPVNPQPGFTLPSPSSATDADLSRFLSQATFGPTPADFSTSDPNSLRSLGFVAWINRQFDPAQTPPSHLLPFVNNTRDVNNPYPEEQTYYGFWRTAVTGQDQLRQRVAFALSEIMVTSAIGVLDSNARALSSYWDCLVDNAFSNYRTLLKNATLHPAMGRYLDMLGNRNGDLVSGRIPNENYAREINQLFSIGLNKLWPDGTLVLDSSFNPIATYDQPVVQGFARVFTGWNYYQPRQSSTNRLPTNFGGFTDATAWVTPMQLFPANGNSSTSAAYHELGSKHLLNNAFIPPVNPVDPNGANDPSTSNKITDTSSPYYGENYYDANGLKDLDKGLDAIFNHQNVGPFICRQLIQRLVTSNPTPGYVYRVVQAFNGERTWDGRVTGVRGDLQEVVKAILLDYEARSTDLLANPSFGKQREPIMRVTAPARYFISKPATGTFTQSSTYNSSTNPFPYRMRIDIQGDLLIGANEWMALTFNSLTSGTVLPTSTYYTNTWYYTRTPPTFTQPGAASPRTNPTFYVDPFGLQGATWMQSSAPKAVTAVNTSTETFTSTAHGLSTNDQVVITATTMPGGVSANTVYYVIKVDSDNFKLTAVSNGTTPVNVTNTGTGVNFVTAGNLITLTSVASAYNTTNHGLTTRPSNGQLPSVYLRFFGASPPTDGWYQLTEVTNSTQFKVQAATSALLVSNPQLPACFTRISNCSYTIAVSDHSSITMNTPVPHGLSVGQSFWVNDNPGNSSTVAITGLWTVASIPTDPVTGNPDPYRFTFSAAGTGTSTLALSAVNIYPNGAPPLDRSGTLATFSSSFQMGHSDNDSTTNSPYSIGQSPLTSPTVFNFFLPDYAYPGDIALNGVTTPEFQLTSDTNTMLLTNFLEQGTEKGPTTNPTWNALTDGRVAFRPQANTGAIVMDMSSLMTAGNLSNSSLATAIIDKLNRELMGGTMSTNMRNSINSYVTGNLPYTTPTTTELRDRIRAVVQLIITSAEFAVQR